MLRINGDASTKVIIDAHGRVVGRNGVFGRKCIVGGEHNTSDNCWFRITDGIVYYHCFDGTAHAYCASVPIGVLSNESNYQVATMVGDIGNKLAKKPDGTVSLIEELDKTQVNPNPVGSHSDTGFSLRSDFELKDTVDSDSQHCCVSTKKDADVTFAVNEVEGRETNSVNSCEIVTTAAELSPTCNDRLLVDEAEVTARISCLSEISKPDEIPQFNEAQATNKSNQKI